MFEQSNLVTMDVHFARIPANDPQAKIGHLLPVGATVEIYREQPFALAHRSSGGAGMRGGAARAAFVIEAEAQMPDRIVL